MQVPAVSKKILFVTNDFGPRAGGIETFIIGLIERLPHASTTVYTSAQSDTREYDAAWLANYGVHVIRDKSTILLPTPRVTRAVTRLVKTEQIEIVAFGAAAPLAFMASSLRRAGAKRIIALTHGHEVWWSTLFPFSLIMRRIGTTTDALTYLGEFTRGAISKALTTKAAGAMVKIAPGIDIEHFAGEREDFEIPRTSLGVCLFFFLISFFMAFFIFFSLCRTLPSTREPPAYFFLSFCGELILPYIL